jgi:chemotaxis protein histidine kinase CheA
VVKGRVTATSDIMSDLTRTTAAEKAAAEEKERRRKAAAEEEAKKIAAEKAAAEEKERHRKVAAEEEAKKIAAEKAATEEKERHRKAAAEEEAKKIAAEKAAAEEKERQRKAAAEEEAKKIAAEKAAAEEKERHRKAAAEEGAWKVSKEGETSKVLAVAAFPVAVGKLTHVFLTHNWADDEDGRSNHHRVSRINKALQKRGITTWFDEERMLDQIRQKMTEGIFLTSCVVVCVTKLYEKKVNSSDLGDNCYYEFDLASRELPNHRIPVVMEDCMLDVRSWEKGRLRGELGGILYVDMSKDEESIFERKCDELATRINRFI